MDITYEYLKKRSSFGRQALFNEQGPEMCDSIKTNPAEFKNYILRNPVHQLIQKTPDMSEHYVNTIRAEYHTVGVNHGEGGWPKDINIHDPEATQRYRRKVEKDEGYIHCVQSLAPGMEHYVMQNNAVDMYRSYFIEMANYPPVEKKSCRTVNMYRDILKRPISSISWQPETGQRFAISYLDVDFYREPRKSVNAYIWEVENANFPEVTLEPQSPMFDLQFSPRDGNLLVGGIATGQVVFFDRRIGGPPQASCAPHVAHRDIARCVKFINTKSGSEFFSSGPDGAVKWWDTRKLSLPTDEMIIDLVKASTDVQSMATALGVSVVEYESTIPTRFMVGTENGLVIGANRKGKTPLEKLSIKYDAHDGPVRSIERNPAFLKNFLTVGDYTLRVWSEDCHESAVLWSSPQRHKVLSGTWSPTRISLLSLCCGDGQMALWDLVRKNHEPVLTMQVCKEPLVAQAFQEKGSLLLLGNDYGNAYMVELSSCLTDSDRYDKGLMTALLEREAKRERILEARIREIKLKQRQAEEGSPVASLTDFDPTVGDRDLAEATADFMAQVRKEFSLM